MGCCVLFVILDCERMPLAQFGGRQGGVTTDRSTTIVPEYAKMGKTFLVYG